MTAWMAICLINAPYQTYRRVILANTDYGTTLQLICSPATEDKGSTEGERRWKWKQQTHLNVSFWPFAPRNM